MPFCLPTIERCKALLGTFVRIRVTGLERATASAELSRCFAELADIHRLMSFQEPDSDISRLNRHAHRHPVRVDARTWEVLRQATAVSQQSDGAFDVTVAPCLVRAGLNAPPRDAATPDPEATWSDVQLLPDQHVHFARPLWIDVSGIAKGYAVDRAMSLLVDAGALQACVNAGGDLSVHGADAEQVRLDVEQAHGDDMIAVVELRNGSLASSGAREGTRAGHALRGTYVEGAKRGAAPARFVTVMAPSCVIADALTKVVIVDAENSRQVLQSFGARALVSEGPHWREVS